MDEKSRPSSRGEGTRDALVAAATLVFARAGFETANLRGIAELAGVNPALIGYHFGNKQGLYLAVFAQRVAQMRQGLEPHWEQIQQALAGPAEQPRERCLEPLLGLVDGIAANIVLEHSAWGELMAREQQSPTAAFELLYEGIISPNLRLLTALLQRLRPGDGPEQLRLIAGSIISQVLVFRNARIPVMRHLDWAVIGDRELAVVRAMMRRNTQLLVLGD